jgi:MFS family permease
MRGRGLSTLGGMLRVGQFVGPFLGAASMTVGGLVASYWLAVGTGVLAAVVLLVVRDPLERATTAPRAGDGAITAVVRDHLPVLRTLGFGMLLIGAARGARQVALPLWADHIGLSPATTSIIFGLSALMETALFYPAGLAMDRLGRRLVVVGSMSLLAVALIVIPLTATAVALGGAAALMGLGNGLGSGINMTIGADASPAVGRAAFLGVFRLFGDVGNGTGPMLLSAVTAVSTLGAGIVAAGATAGVAAYLMSRWLPHRPRPDLAVVPE